MYLISGDAKNNFSNVEENFKKLPPEEQAAFKVALAECVGYLLEKEEITALSKVITKMGFEGEIRTMAREVKRRRDEDLKD